jgi:hypothetical protein
MAYHSITGWCSMKSTGHTLFCVDQEVLMWFPIIVGYEIPVPKREIIAR